MTPKEPARLYVEELCLEFPHAGSHTLARMAMRDERKLFTNTEHARSVIRRVRGLSGKKSRTASVVPRLPKGKTSLLDPTPYQLPNGVKVLLLPDIHVPYHDDRAVSVAVKYGVDFNPDIVLLNGDAFDAHSISWWCRDPRERNFKEEVKAMVAFLAWLRSKFPKAQILYKEGNHEERYEKYMIDRCPEFLGIAAFEFDSLLEMDASGIEYIGDQRAINAGELTIIHGHEYKFAISNPVNPARGLFTRALNHALCGHFHQESKHTENNIRHQSVTTWSTGCLCDLRPKYRPYNKWSHGFATVEIDRGGKFSVTHKKIGSDKVY